MDTESSTKFIGSLTKFLQSLCNGYVEFDDGVELIGHIYLNVDSGKSGKALNYFLNEKVCKSDNSVTFISNSFHAQPEAKSKASSGKDSDSRKEDGDISDSGDNVPKSTNVGTLSSRSQLSSRSGASPNQNRTGVQIGTKRPGSPLKGPPPSQRRGHSPPSQRRLQSSGARATGSSPVSKTVPSSPSSSSQDNVPSPSISRKHRNEASQPTSNQSDNVNADNENDMLSIHPTPEFASFLGSLTNENQTSQDQPSPPDTKPDTDVTFIKEEFVSEPSSCAQAGSSGHSGRSGEDSSGLYPVMLHQNTSVFPSTSAGYHGYQAGASATATSQHGGFPGSSSSQSDPYNPVPGTSQDGADPSDMAEVVISGVKRLSEIESAAQQSEQSAKTLPLQPEVASSSPYERLTQHSSSEHFLTPPPYPSQSGLTDPNLRSGTLFRVGAQSASLQTAQMQATLQTQQVSSASQLKTILQSPLTGSSKSMFPQRVETSLPVSQGDRIILHEPQPSTSSAPHQQWRQQQPCSSSLQQVTPSHLAGMGYPGFSQPQLTSHFGSTASSSHSPRSSPVDPMVHSSTSHFPLPQGQHRSPGRPRLWGEKKEYNCYECGKIFKSQQALGYHRNAKHGHREDLMCPLCGKMLSHKQHKSYHMKNVHKIEDFELLSL